jgi:hypothetical protein
LVIRYFTQDCKILFFHFHRIMFLCFNKKNYSLVCCLSVGIQIGLLVFTICVHFLAMLVFHVDMFQPLDLLMPPMNSEDIKTFVVPNNFSFEQNPTSLFLAIYLHNINNNLLVNLYCHLYLCELSLIN